MTTPTTVKVQLKLRQDTSSGWSAVNPILLAGELGRESNTGKIKIGDGSTAWNSLAYQPFGALITNADISATAEIAVSKLADGAARQLLQTDTAGTGVEWTSNVDVPGTLDVTGAATFDAAVTIDGNSTAASFIPTGSTVPTNGVYLSAANNVSIATNSTERLRIDAAGQIEAVSLGSAAAPTFSWTGDPNTGIYSPGADQVAISTNGTGRLFVDSNGKVGIGTATAADDAVLTVTKGTNIAYPGQNNAQLHINNSTGAAGVLIASSTLSNIFFADAAANNVGRIYYDHSSDFLAVHTNSSERLRLDSSGRLGLGTSSPVATLDVGGSTATSNGGLSNVNLYAGFTPTGGGNTFGGVLAGAGVNGNTPFIAASRNGAGTGLPLTFFTDGTERIRISSTGNVGIGTTSPLDALNVSDGTATFQLKPIGGSSVGYFGMRTNHALAFNTNDTERARIDSSGRLLVGTSSARSNYSAYGAALLQAEGANNDGSRAFSFTYGKADAGDPIISLGKHRSNSVGGVTVVNDGDGIGQVVFAGSDGTNFVTGATIRAQVDGTPGANDMPGRLVFSTTANGASSPTERMRISNDGTININATGNPWQATGNNPKVQIEKGRVSAANYQGSAFTANRTDTNGSVFDFYREAVFVGSISVTTTATAYNTSSDYRLKENVVPLTGAADRLNQLQVHRFNFIADPDCTVDGFLAHEAQAVVPECVTGTKDEVDDEGNPVYQGIDQSKLVPLLTAALQEALQKIEDLEGRLTAAGL